MSTPAASPDTGGIGGHPRGLTNLFFTEMWERFGYYGMRALLVYFMTKPAAEGGLAFDTARGGLIYGTYTMAVYMLSIPGGFIADNFLGARLAVLYSGILIAAGYFTLAIHSVPAFFTGLVLVALGTGMLKPNISTMVGMLYRSDDDRRDAGFSIFYMGINVGAFCAPLVTGWLAQSAAFKSLLAGWGFDPARSWHWGFAAAGLGMTFGLIVYLVQAKRLAHVGHPPPAGQPRPWGGLAKVLLGTAAVFAFVAVSDRYTWLRWTFLAAPVAATLWFGFHKDPERRRMAAIFVFCIAAMIFWALFEQAGSTIALFADQLTRTEIFGFNFPSAWFQSVNSIFVITLAPLFAWLWVRLGHNQPSSPAKFVIALFILALSFLLMVPAAQATASGKVSPFWIVGLFFVQTVGELCISPVGLSVMTKLAPARLTGLVMGMWFLAASLGNKLAGVFAGEFKPDAGFLSAFFLKQALFVGVAAVAMLALVRWMRRLMGEVK
jgi:POT family proton-dependent oligopeptide transporter